jgi:hypothetical protein
MKEVEYDELVDGSMYCLYFRQDDMSSLLYICHLVRITPNSLVVTAYYGNTNNQKYKCYFEDINSEGLSFDLHYDPDNRVDLCSSVFYEMTDDEIEYHILTEVL